MKKGLFLFFLAIVLSLSLHAQDRFNCVDLSLNNVAEVRCVPCDTNGFCIVRTQPLGDSLKQHFEVYDTRMQPLRDTFLRVGSQYSISLCNFENDEVAVLLKREISKKSSSYTSILFNIADKRLIARNIVDSQPVKDINNLHHFSGNLIFSTTDFNGGDMVWFLPAGVDVAKSFDFNSKYKMKVLDAVSESETGTFAFCVAADGKTFFFKTDPHGNTKFAKISEESSTSASLLKVHNGNYILVFNELKDDALAVRSALISDAGVEKQSTFSFVREATGRVIEETGDPVFGRALTSSPRNTAFSPVSCFKGDKMLAAVVDIYVPEYRQHYNGHFYDTRFYGFRHQYAGVLFYDTNGRQVKYMKVPFNDTQMIHSGAYAKTKAAFLEDGGILLYFMDSDGLTTQLMDSSFVVVDPARSSEIPLRSRMYKKRNAEVDVFESWYGKNYFLLSAVQFSTERKNSMVGYIVNKLKFK
ncbi:MAG: hypothetical protein SPL47_07060 [Bacteroidales bacterium]|nr:hypothetical protein [Bacteroidales bacterium]